MSIFGGPPPGFMEALAQKYAIMQQEADAKTALQGAQTNQTMVQTDLAPGLAAAQIGKLGAETEFDSARAGLTREGITDARQMREVNPQMASIALAIELAKRTGQPVDFSKVSGMIGGQQPSAGSAGAGNTVYQLPSIQTQPAPAAPAAPAAPITGGSNVITRSPGTSMGKAPPRDQWPQDVQNTWRPVKIQGM